MANKSALFGGRVVKVENRSSFDKSRLNALTTGVGTITPILKQLVIPSSGRISLNIHAELPPLATNAFLRTHLKVEAFFIPLRLCYGGFQSFFSGEEIYNASSADFYRAKLPIGMIPLHIRTAGTPDTFTYLKSSDVDARFGHSTLTDYFNCKFAYSSNHVNNPGWDEMQLSGNDNLDGMFVNIMPYIAYHLCYHHFYRNKSVQRPCFAPHDAADVATPPSSAAHLPFVSASTQPYVVLGPDIKDSADTYNLYHYVSFPGASGTDFSDDLLDGTHLWELRQRNYGDDYFTASRPQAQAGSPISVQTDVNGRFTVSALRLANAMQEFEEVNNYATPDYVQTLMARYGASLSDGVAQKPIILGSADFPMFTKGVELTSLATNESQYLFRNPFTENNFLGATAGRASANGSEFVCDFNVNEPGYILVNATLVPEANYGDGVAHDMRIFTSTSSLPDIPCGLLEHVGDEPIYEYELLVDPQNSPSNVFGYVQRYLWHKSGGVNEVHGLFRPGQSLEAFVPQRIFTNRSQISSAFLEIPTDALDSVAAVSHGISQYGVMIDCAFKFSVSEPLSESALPALSNPAVEHGRSVYLKNGGSKLA